MSLRFQSMLLLCLTFAGCDSPAAVDAFEAEATEIAARVAPGAMTVTGSTSNRMRDAGRTVALDYDAEGYAFPVTLDLGPLGCKTRPGGCEADLRRQIGLGRDGLDAERILAPAIAACDLAFPDDRRRVDIRALSIEPLIRHVDIALESLTPLADRGPEGLAAAEACVEAVLAAHAAGPFGDLETSLRLTLPREAPFPEPDGLEGGAGDGDRPYFALTVLSTRADRPAAWQVHLPFAWSRAFQPLWSEFTQTALDAAGIAVDVSPGPEAGPVRPMRGDRGRWVVHLYAADRSSGSAEAEAANARVRPDHVVRIHYDARTGDTRAACVVRDVRDAAGRIVPARIEGPCTEPIGAG